MIDPEKFEKLRREAYEEDKAKRDVLYDALEKLEGKSISDLVILKKYWLKEIKQNKKLDDISTKKREDAKCWVKAIEKKLDKLDTQIEPTHLEGTNKNEYNPDNMSVSEAARYLKISVSTLYKMTSTKKIPFRKVGAKKLSFSKSDLDDYLKNQRIKPQNEIEGKADAYLSNKRFKKKRKPPINL